MELATDELSRRPQSEEEVRELIRDEIEDGDHPLLLDRLRIGALDNQIEWMDTQARWELRAQMLQRGTIRARLRYIWETGRWPRRPEIELIHATERIQTAAEIVFRWRIASDELDKYEEQTEIVRRE